MAGVVAAGGRLVAGCSSRTAESPPAPVLRDLHFDLSHTGETEGFTLDLGLRRIPLAVHDAASRALARKQNGLLGAVPDARLTHFALQVSCPSDAVQSYVVSRASEAGGGLRSMAMAGILVPAAAVAEARSIWGESFSFRAPLARWASSRLGTNAEWSTDQLTAWNDPYDAARYVVFHHPELLTLDPVTATRVLQRVEDLATYDPDNPGPLDDLAITIGTAGQAVEPGSPRRGWASGQWLLDANGQRVPVQGEDGKPVLEDGKPVYAWQYVPDNLVLRDASRVIARALIGVRNDPTLEANGANPKPRYVLLPGRDVAPPPASAASSAVSLGYRWSCAREYDWRWGQRVRIRGYDDAARTVRFSVDNNYFRHLDVAVAFRDVDDNILSPDGSPAGQAAYRYRWLGLVGCPARVLAVPVSGDGESGEFEVTMPANAATLCILTGAPSFVDNGDMKQPQYLQLNYVSTVMTVAFELGLPTLLLGLGLGGMALEKAWQRLLVGMGGKAVAIAIQMKVEQDTSTQGGDWLSMGMKVLNMIFTKALGYGFYTIIGEVAADLIAEETAKKSTPILGWCLYAADCLVTAAEISTTLTEMSLSAACVETRVAATHRVVVKLHHDAEHTLWPQTATQARFIAICSKAHVFEAQVKLPDVMECSVYTYEMPYDIPAGGTITVRVELLSDKGWLAGVATATVANLVPAGESALVLELCIHEFLVPIDSTTTYFHKMKLALDAGGIRRWQALPSPRATAASLGCDVGAPALCSPGAITLSNKVGQIGYSFQSAHPGYPLCGTPASGGVQTHQVQNVNLSVDIGSLAPEATLRSLTCGDTRPALLLYDIHTDLALALVATAGTYFLRQLPMPTGAGSWGDLSSHPCLGRFSARDYRSATYHSAGFVVALDATCDKLEILAIGDAVPAGQAASARSATLVSGPGAQRGSIRGAVAVAATHSGRCFLVLEQENWRLQALDDSGNPVDTYFGDGRGVNWVPLRAEPDGRNVRLLDLSVEATGLVYVLSHAGDGTDVSDYHLDIYSRSGNWVSRTTGVAAARMMVDLWRNVYTVNFERIDTPSGRSEPSVSEWIPSTPPTPLTPPTVPFDPAKGGGLCSAASPSTGSLNDHPPICRP